jgi:VIT1/CCC1 family predicted Fe2+/Mn2+ transporter
VNSSEWQSVAVNLEDITLYFGEELMKNSFKIGLSFGLTSGVITTLGLMVGLNSGTHSRLVVIGGILTIAIADAFSDALGIHISVESSNTSEKEIWESTISAFLTKLVFASTFIVPALLLELSTAVIASIIWGLSLLSILSYKVAKSQGTKPWKAVAEHLTIAVIVIVLTHYVGLWISLTFG